MLCNLPIRKPISAVDKIRTNVGILNALVGRLADNPYAPGKKLANMMISALMGISRIYNHTDDLFTL